MISAINMIYKPLTHWGRVTHICVSKLAIIAPDVAWSAPSHNLNQWWNIVNSNHRNKRQWKLKRNHIFSFKKMHLKISAAKWRPFCLGLNVLKWWSCISANTNIQNSCSQVDGSYTKPFHILTISELLSSKPLYENQLIPFSISSW